MPRLSSAYQPLLRSYVDSVRVNSVSLQAEAVFCRLLAVSDGGGKYFGDAATVGMKAFTRRLSGGLRVAELEGYLAELEGAGLVRRWVADGEKYLLIENYFRGNCRGADAFPGPPGMANRPLTVLHAPHGDTVSPTGDVAEQEKEQEQEGEQEQEKEESRRGVEKEQEESAVPAQPAPGSAAFSPPLGVPASHGDLYDLGRRLVYAILLPTIGKNTVTKAAQILAGPGWLQDYPEDAVRDALQRRVEEAQTKDGPGGWLMAVLKAADTLKPGSVEPRPKPADKGICPQLQDWKRSEPEEPELTPDELEHQAARCEKGFPSKAAEFRARAASMRAAQ